MVPQKIKILTLECGLLWNMIILKSEPPYCAFTQQGSWLYNTCKFFDWIILDLGWICKVQTILSCKSLFNVQGWWHVGL
jgi:hypothetical protein